jgi:hypothetical protein
MVGSGTMVRVWWRSQCTGNVHLGLITNVASDSCAVKYGQPYGLEWDGSVSCIFSLMHINGRAILEQLSPCAEFRDGWIPPNEFMILAVYDGLRQRRG